MAVETGAAAASVDSALDVTAVRTVVPVVADAADIAGESGLAGAAAIERPVVTEEAALRSLLDSEGATEARADNVEPNRRFWLSETTHIITEDLDFPEAKAAMQAGIHLVTIPESDLGSLFGAICAFGGQYRVDYSHDVTHVLATAAEGEDYEEALRGEMTLIVPHYIDDCLRIKRRIREDHYLWPRPRILFDDPLGPIEPPTPPKEEDLEPRDPLYLAGQTFYFDPGIQVSIDIAARMGIKTAGGSIASEYNMRTVTCVVLKDRKGPLYAMAERDGKYVGSLRWLKDTLDKRELRSPKLKALHYPRPDPLPEFRNYIISVTNYAGQARQDIETMVNDLGGRFTKNLASQNTHLICARPISDKFERAMDWNLHIVNHLWLEETYVHHAKQSISRWNYSWYVACLANMVGEVVIPEAEVQRSIRLCENPLLPSPDPPTRQLSRSHSNLSVRSDGAAPRISKPKINAGQSTAELKGASSLTSRAAAPPAKRGPTASGLRPEAVEAALLKKASTANAKANLSRTSSGSGSRPTSADPDGRRTSSGPVVRPQQSNPEPRKPTATAAGTRRGTAAQVDVEGELPSSGVVANSLVSGPARSSRILPSGRTASSSTTAGVSKTSPTVISTYAKKRTGWADGVNSDAADEKTRRNSDPVSLGKANGEAIEPEKPAPKRGSTSAPSSARARGKGKASAPDESVSSTTPAVAAGGSPGRKAGAKLRREPILIIDDYGEEAEDARSTQKAKKTRTSPRRVSAPITAAPLARGKGAKAAKAANAADAAGEPSAFGRKRKRTEDLVESGNIVGRTPGRAGKRAKFGAGVEVVTTGVRLTKEQSKGISSLGGKEGTKVETCTHFIAKKVSRTEKFFMAVIHSKPIVTEEWLDESIKAGEWLDVDDYRLKDEASEEALGFSLEEALHSAAQRKVLAGYSFYVTPGVKIEADVLRRIVEAAGGKILQKVQLRRLKALPPNTIVNNPDGSFISSLADNPHLSTATSPSSTPNGSRAICISSENEHVYHESLRKQGLKIYKVDLVLVGILTQRLDFDDEGFLISGTEDGGEEGAE
ncbi:hypothetical protein HK101_010183 [Irineochytrium annulatum]|nr:hypothetical protein HK101_010183 [Irineochytrium annulatum]